MNNTVKFLIIFMLALIIGGIGGYYFAPKKEITVATSEPKVTTDTIPSDEVPDAELFSELSALPDAKPADTAFNSLVLSVGDRKVSFTDLLEFKDNYNGIANDMIVQRSAAYQFLASLPDQNIRVLELFEMLRQQASLLTRQDFKFVGNPKQTKIAYSWGSKHYQQRAEPSHELGGTCTHKVHGLDCSGFIFQLFTANNIPIPEDLAYADMERRPKFLKKCLEPFFQGQAFKVEDLGPLKANEMNTGDIVYFRNKKTNNVSHIAMVLVNDQGTVSLFQSLGMPATCNVNLDIKHGPIVKILDKAMKEDSRKYGCVRITAI